MRQGTLEYHCPHARTLEWQRNYAGANWEAALSTAEGDEIVLRRDAADGVIRAQHREERFALRLVRSAVNVLRPEEEQPVATLRRRWFYPNDVSFADGRLVHIAPARSFQVTRTQRVNFLERGQPLLLMRKLFWPIGGKRLRIDTTDAGIAFPGRTMLEVLGFYEMVVYEMTAD